MRRRPRSTPRAAGCLLPLCLLAAPAAAQEVVRQDEVLGPDRPEAWAMDRAAGASLMTAFGETPALAPGRWQAALDLGHIPRLDDAQQTIGFDGLKREDLNKTPVFGRVRVAVGLPAGWVAELGYTPPVSIGGARPRDLVAVAFGHRLLERGSFGLSARVFGQHGGVEGDITCPRELAGLDDPVRNPYGCGAPSRDRLALDLYGADLTAGWGAGAWHWHASLGLVRSELQVQVDALTFGARDRSRLVADGWLHPLAFGVRRDLGPRWSVAAELLHLPLHVRRGPGADRDSEPLDSLRLQLRYDSR